CPSRQSRRGPRRTQSSACHRPQAHHRRLSRVPSLYDTGSSRTLRHRPAAGWPTGTMTQTRRLAAILAADVVGYSRLMGLDEAGTVQAVRDHRAAANPLIAQHGGRIVKTTGDGILIEFSSVVGAVECALALQRLATERNAGIAVERRMEWR